MLEVDLYLREGVDVTHIGFMYSAGSVGPCDATDCFIGVDVTHIGFICLVLAS